jgi:FdhD protein
MREIADQPRAGSSTEVRTTAVDGTRSRSRFDRVATEEPLEIRLRAGRATRTLAITMRTPGSDFELAAGFLLAEGVVASPDDISGISYCVDRDVGEEQRYNIVNVDLTGSLPALETLERRFVTNSACGVCGKASLEALYLRGVLPLASEASVAASTLALLPERLRAAQGVFEKTGGLHAAALFDTDGRLIALREDVGRHNALDKLIGWALLSRQLPFDDSVVMVSGRTSYEIVQKALVARAAIVCAVSAPSSLAVDLARSFDMTLIGFLRPARFNIYAGAERVRLDGVANG